jgi:hypothetical protein
MLTVQKILLRDLPCSFIIKLKLELQMEALVIKEIIFPVDFFLKI